MLLKYSIEEMFTILLSNTSSAKYKLLSRNLSELKNWINEMTSVELINYLMQVSIGFFQ